MAQKIETNLGKYLYSQRILRKYENISDYLTVYPLRISESYYRDLEAGRKTVRIETAIEICNALKLEPQEFFYYLLKDILPIEVFETIIKPTQKGVFEAAGNEIERLSSKIEILRKAYEKAIIEDPFQIDDVVAEYLSNNFELLPLIHFIYMRNICTYKEIKQIMKVNHISKDFSELLVEFKNNYIADIDDNSKTIRRHKRIFRLPPTPNGRKLKDDFVVYETKASTENKNRDQLVASNNSFIFSTITCLNSLGKIKIKEGATNFLASLKAEETDLEAEDTTPFFVSMVISSRERYDVKTLKQKEN